MAEIQKVLIANRGEIAVRIIHTLKRMNIASVVIYHAADVDSIAVAQADESIEIFGDTPVARTVGVVTVSPGPDHAVGRKTLAAGGQQTW
jgi:biotin carboxylase